MPFLIRPGVVVKTPSRCLGDLIRDVWRGGVEHARREHAAVRKGYPDADARMTDAQLAAWRAEPFPELGEAEDQDDWRAEADEVYLEIYAITGEQWDRYQSMLRDAREGDAVDRVVALREAYRYMVRIAINNVTGFEDERGSFTLKRSLLADEDEPTLPADSVAVLERDGWLTHMAQAAANYQRLTDAEKGNFGGQQRRTSAESGSNVTAAHSQEETRKGATKTASNDGATLPMADTKPAGALHAPS